MKESLDPHWRVAAPDGAAPLTVPIAGVDTHLTRDAQGALTALRGSRRLTARVACGLVWIWLGPPGSKPTPLPDTRAHGHGLCFPWFG